MPARVTETDVDGERVRAALACLPETLRRVLTLRYLQAGPDLPSLAAVGRPMNLSREYVRRLHHAALAALREVLVPEVVF